MNGGWQFIDAWVKTIVPAITEMYKGANGGWFPTHRWELELP